MHYSIKITGLIFLLALSVTLARASSGESAKAIDPVVVSPDMYRVLLENDYVRAVEYQVNPGEKDNWHTHPAKISYVISGGALRIVTGGGDAFTVKEETGSIRWFGAVGRHYAENVGNTPVHIIFVEVKGIDTKKEDLSKFKPGAGKHP